MPSNNLISSKRRISSAELADSLSLSSDSVSLKLSGNVQNIQKSVKYRPITALPDNLSIKNTRNVSSTKAYITAIPSLREAPQKNARTIFPHFTITPATYTNQFADNTTEKKQSTRNAKQRTDLPKLRSGGKGCV